MSEHEMNIACSKVLGYTVREAESHGTRWELVSPHGKAVTPLVSWETIDFTWKDVPKFCTDKNSHDALFAYIEANGLGKHFSAILRERLDSTHRYKFDGQAFAIASAPAAVVVEAFLRTVGKWEED